MDPCGLITKLWWCFYNTSKQIVQFEDESHLAVRLERLVQLKQVWMSKIISHVNLS